MSEELKPYDLWRKLHYLRNEDYKTNDEQLANVCAAIEADRKAAQTEAADTIEAQAAEIEELRAQLKTVLDREAETHRRHDAKVEAQAAEIKLLREALRGMIEYSRYNERWQDAHPEYVAAARAALGETE